MSLFHSIYYKETNIRLRSVIKLNTNTLKSKISIKILLVNTNTYSYMAPPPIGIAYSIGTLSKTEHQFIIIDLMFDKHPENTLISTINNYKPDIIGYSIHHLDNQSMSESTNPLPAIKKYINAAKYRNIITILGGTGFSYLPQEMLNYLEADYGIWGQGETSFVSLVKSLKKNNWIKAFPVLYGKKTIQ